MTGLHPLRSLAAMAEFDPLRTSLGWIDTGSGATGESGHEQSEPVGAAIGIYVIKEAFEIFREAREARSNS